MIINYAWEEIEYERPVERVQSQKVDYKLVRRRQLMLYCRDMAYFHRGRTAKA